MNSLSTFFIALMMMGCGLTTTRPKVEMSLAQSAILAAQKANAPEKAPNLYRKAELLYIKAKSAYKRKYFNKARDYALASQKLSERAEFDAKRKAVLGDD